MTTIDWLEAHAPGFRALSVEERDVIMHFSFLWGLFGSEVMDRHADANALVATARRWAERGLLDAQLFDEHLGYFRDRYCHDSQFTHHFDALNLPDGEHRNLECFWDRP